ncbi:hypothetical protein AX17_000731 [Amanita inopinata Kibby_2008]|nr:hypothetical protein AX17_000731 [Amanita inopinata Kibby_2008]
MVKVNTIDISPPIINSACAWSSDFYQLQALYDSPYTGAVTTRTTTLKGFREDDSHSVAFTSSTTSTLNSYGYSPHPLATYLSWIEHILANSQMSKLKPFIISITASDMNTLQSLVQHIQRLRQKLRKHADTDSEHPPVAIEVNTSCPNIPNASPPGYEPSSLSAILSTLAEEFAKDHSLTLGLKLPPFVYHEQFLAVLEAIKSTVFSIEDGSRISPIAFVTCTNTLGSSLLFSEQVVNQQSDYAVPTALGGLAGELIHPLALGNVHVFANLFQNAAPGLPSIKIIGVGGVTSKEAAERMFKAGAAIAGCATLLGKEGIHAFEILHGDT